MNNSFTYPREKFDEGGVDRKLLLKLIQKHQEEVSRLRQNMSYYYGKHSISKKQREGPNCKPVCNHAKDISDTASSYFMGAPIAYSSVALNDEQVDITPLVDAFKSAYTDDVDQDNALMLSIYGCAYEYIYVKEGETTLSIKGLSPENTFVVYDDTIEHNELFAVFYYEKKDDVNDKNQYVATVCTDTYTQEITLYATYAGTYEGGKTKDEKEHYLGHVPINELKNNKFCIGDFEQQIGLIDAYNALMADRINDKEQFIDAILVIYGALLGDNEEEAMKAHKELNKKKLLELDSDAKAEYLTRTFDEAGIETLRKALKEDIYTFSHVPNLTDENFAGNSSGVAMEYKLLGLEMLTKTKERYYRKALRKRIEIFCYFLNLKAKAIDASVVVPTFSRALPKNLSEIASMISTLSGTVSQKTLIKLLPFVEDPDGEIEAVNEQKEKAADLQRKVFEGTANEPPVDGNE